MSIARQESPAPRITQRDLEASSPASQGLIIQFVIFGLACSGCLTSTTATPPVAPVPVVVRAAQGQASLSGNGLSIDDLPGPGPDIVSLAAMSAPGQPVPIPQAAALAAQVRDLREASGLTTEQIARLFGVSRRAVHLWASGGRMNAAHHEQLARLLATIRMLPGHTPEQRKAALLTPDQDGLSLFDRLRSEHKSGDEDVSGAPWRPADLLRES